MAALLSGVPYDVVVLADVPGATLPEETGTSYEANALIKARAAATMTGVLAVADDSGIEVDALGGEPGVFSARFGGEGLDDAGRVAHLLARLHGVPAARRTGRYRCVLALATPDGASRCVEGTVEGVVLTEPRGAGGFGYDPVFLYPPLGRTFAEITPAEKDRVSHRGAAMRALRPLLAQR
jgi:XTP/dITP diphosphohydrolase